MPRDPEKYLHDILDSVEFLMTFTGGRTIADYVRDRGFRSAVERELQIVGEALLQLHSVQPAIAARITEYQRIIRFRHVLVHGYAELKADLVWQVIEEKLSILRDEAQALLRETNDSSG